MSWWSDVDTRRESYGRIELRIFGVGLPECRVHRFFVLL
jgi:hypothetical protein